MSIRVDNKLSRWASKAPANVKLGNNKAGLTASQMIKRTSFPLVPFYEGFLHADYSTTIVDEKFKVITEFKYSVKDNPRTNYDYAFIQHENEEYHHEFGTHHYLSKAVSIETPFILKEVKLEFIKSLHSS